ncbi:histone H1.01-like [Rhinoderma darwinii]|uniref:histone H1.01-like n=1 Tax=Rhinoderma darwinii TaxID=43563 RepID=UPI003F664B67
MAETAPAAAVPLTEPAAKSKKQPKKTAAGGAKKIKKPSGPSVSELIVKAVSASKERSGVSLAALKKALAAGGYDVDKKNSRLKMALKTLVTKETLLQVKGSGASGSFKLNKKQLETKDKAVKKLAAAAKSPKKTPAKSLTKAKRPAAAKKVAKSPKKPKPAPKKITKSPAKKAAKPKAAKSPAKKAPKATKSPAKKAAKSPAKKAPKAAKSPAKKAAKSPAKKAPKAAKSPAKKASKSRKTVAKK